MVASLQYKKEALEAKLKDKTNELKKVCFEEAELTGILPVETPLEPGEIPPHFPRRIGTSFALPENLIDKLYSREDRAIASLELECQIQTGIAEAALSIINDGSSSRSVRRRHKLIYQESQRKLIDLEAKLNKVKSGPNRLIKKNNSIVAEGGGPGSEVDKNICSVSSIKHETLQSLTDTSVPPAQHYHSYNGLSRVNQSYALHTSNLDKHGYYSTVNYNNVPNYQPPFTPIPYQNQHDSSWYVDNARNSGISTQYYSNETYECNASINRSRACIAERNGNYNKNINERMISTLPRNNGTSSNSVLLPGQTYPDNSLTRTQSLGNVANYNQAQAEKKKEKRWYETSLDSSPVESRSNQVSGCTSPVSLVRTPEPIVTSHVVEVKYSSSPVKTQVASINNFQYEMVVPYESPKNHTVIEAGKWQPYREVTKPFEMSDFYKYSTKFRKGQTSPALNNSNKNDNIVQQKAIYQPLQPQECQPLNNEVRNTVSPVKSMKTAPSPYEQSSKWYNDKPSNSGTFV